MKILLDYRDYSSLLDYCKSKCAEIHTISINSKNHDKIGYYRGLYKGYLYQKKLFTHLIKKKTYLRKYEVHNFLKEQNRRILQEDCNVKGFIRGIMDSFYDMMNRIQDC